MELDELLHTLATERDLDLRGYKHTTLERRLRKPGPAIHWFL